MPARERPLAELVVTSPRVAPVDATLRLETPEGIDVELRPAGPVARGLAIMIDEAIAWVVSIAIAIALSVFGEAGVGVYFVVYFLIEWFYPVLFEVLRHGQTPGKAALGLRVVSDDAPPIGWSDSLVRNLLRVVDFLPLGYLAGVVSVVTTRHFQRLGDLAAGSLVVHADRVDRFAAEARAAIRTDRAEADRRLGAAPLPLPLAVAERRSLVGFAERQADLSDERILELTDLLEPLSGATGEEGRRRVVRMANGIAGVDG
jgi:uncharacterized RDD family membrane protein YckC